MSAYDPRDDYDDLLDGGPLARPEIVRWPASIMWVFGLLQLIIAQMVVALLVCTVVVVDLVDDNKTIGDIWDKVKNREAIWVILIGWPLATVGNIVVMRAANGLKRFRRYPWVVAGAVLTFLSIPCIYLAVVQVPLALWLIVLLVRRDVRARFDAVARAAKNSLSPSPELPP